LTALNSQCPSNNEHSGKNENIHSFSNSTSNVLQCGAAYLNLYLAEYYVVDEDYTYELYIK
jgi:hypothetical protein